MEISSKNILLRFSILNTNLETLIHKVNLENVVSTKKPSFSKYVFLFQKNTPDSHICITLGKSKIHKTDNSKHGFLYTVYKCGNYNFQTHHGKHHFHKETTTFQKWFFFQKTAPQYQKCILNGK